jgi:hypothetical protein
MRGFLFVISIALCTPLSGSVAAQEAEVFERQESRPPALAPARFRYGRTVEEAVTITVPRRAKPVPLLVWFPWPKINMENHQNPRWIRSFMFDQGVGMATIEVTTKSSQSLPHLTESCVRALAEIVRQASKRGYDPERIIFGGWGWGSHAAALIATDPAYAALAGVPFQNIRGLLLIEPAGLDLEGEQKLASNYVRKQFAKLMAGAGNPSRYSAISHLARPNAPAALILSSAQARDRAALDASVVEALRSNGISVTLRKVGPADDDVPGSMIGGPGHSENRSIKEFLDRTVR